MVILLCLFVGYLVTGKFDNDKTRAAYEAGHEPPRVAKARMKHDEAKAGLRDPERTGLFRLWAKGKERNGAFRLWFASRWARTWDGLRESGEAKTAAKRLWMEKEGHRHKSAKQLARMEGRLRASEAALDRWDELRGVISAEEVQKRADEREAVRMHAKVKAAEAEQERRIREAEAQEAAELEEAARARAERDPHEPFDPLDMAGAVPRVGDVDPDRPFARKTDDALEDFFTSPDGAVTDEVRQEAKKEIDRRAAEAAPKDDDEAGGDEKAPAPADETGSDPKDAPEPGAAEPGDTEPAATDAGDVSTDPGANVVEWKPVGNTNGSNGSSAASNTEGAGMHYSQWVREYIQSADMVGGYSVQMKALMDALGAWGGEVTEPSAIIASQLAQCEGEYRDLAARVQHQGSQGEAAHRAAHWVRPDHRVMSD